MLHIKTKPDAALYVRHEKPDFKREYDREKYWDIERQRWHEGYNGITGTHYMYLQEMKLQTITGEVIRPSWRECDSEFFDGWEKTKTDHWDMMLIKRTELGFSSMAGAAIPIHTMLTNPGSKSILTSADDIRRSALFHDKLLVAFDNLDDDIRPEKARFRSRGSQNLFLATEDRQTKTFSGLKSSTIGIDTVKNPEAFEAHRAMYILIDELFLHPKSSRAKAAAARRLTQGTKKIGSMLFGGTCGLSSTKGTQEAKKIYKSASITRVNVLALLGNRGLEEFMTNGWEDIEAAENWRQQNLERLGKADDKTEYFKFLIDYPGSIEEVFNLVTDCALPIEYQHILDTSQRHIDTEQIKAATYKISSNGVRVTAEPDITSEINIVKPPIPGHRYIAGTDPIPFGNNLLGEGSDYSIVILDIETMEFVADYTLRNLDPTIVVNNSILLQKLYYRAPTMLELNRGEVVLKEYLARGEQSLLAPMPTHLGIVWEDRKYPYGFSAGGGQGNQVNSRCEVLVLKWLVAHGSKCRHARLIYETKKLSTEANTDVLSAAKAALLYKAEIDEVAKIDKYSPITHKVRRLVRENGRMVQKIFDSTLLDDGKN